MKNSKKTSTTDSSLHAPQGKRTPRLFKVEFEGDKIISLCNKSYCTEKFPSESSPGQVKFSIKGVNKGQFNVTL